MIVAELISLAKQGSLYAQQKLFELLSPRAKMLCTRYVKNSEDAEEIMLDGFYEFFKKMRDFKYEHETGLYAYVKQIMISKCQMFLRKSPSLYIVSENEAASLPFPDSVLDKLSFSEIYYLVLQLPVGYRTVFNLYSIEGYEHKAIAKMLGIKESASRSSFARARSILQKMLTSKEIYSEKQSSK